MVVGFGGDGTLNEVVNGLMELPIGSRPALGIVASGTGRDFFRRLAELHSFPKNFSWLLQTRERPVDVGRALLGFREGETKRYFINIADAGISGEVVRRMIGSRRRLGPLEYLLSTLQAAWSYGAPRVKVRIHGKNGELWERELVLLLGVAANGRYFGGGMCIAPEAALIRKVN